MECNYLMSRQPIFAPAINLVAYEIRSHPIEAATGEDSSSGADRTLFTMFTDSTLDHIVGAYDCFVDITVEGLAQGLWKSTPKSHAVLAFFNEFEPSDAVTQDLLTVLDHGYRIAISGGLRAGSLDLLANRAHAIQLDAINYAPSDLEKRVQEL